MASRQRDYHQEYQDRQDRAHNLGFASDSERTEARRYAREEWGLDNVSSAELDRAALLHSSYAPGDLGEGGFDALKAQWIDWHGYDEDWEPDEDFYAWLDDLSGEPA